MTPFAGVWHRSPSTLLCLKFIVTIDRFYLLSDREILNPYILTLHIISQLHHITPPLNQWWPWCLYISTFLVLSCKCCFKSGEMNGKSLFAHLDKMSKNMRLKWPKHNHINHNHTEYRTRAPSNVTKFLQSLQFWSPKFDFVF